MNHDDFNDAERRSKLRMQVIYEGAKKPNLEIERLREENERLHVENRRLIDRIETIGVPVGVGGFATTTSAQPKLEPVACKECHLKDTVYDLLGDLKVTNLKLSIRGKRTLIGLTDEEREQVINANTSTGLWHMAKDIEAKLKEKNT